MDGWMDRQIDISKIMNILSHHQVMLKKSPGICYFWTTGIHYC